MLDKKPLDVIDVIDTETTEAPDDCKKTIPLTSFIEDFGQSLLSAVSQQNPPVYQTAVEKRAAILNALKRKPFEAQQKIIQAVTTLLLDKGERAAIINADMGTGKTIMGVATAAVLHAEGYQRTLIISPPHLVYKWRREILETVEGAKVWILNGPDALLKLIQLREWLRCKENKNNKKNQETQNPEFFILGRVRMRMGYHWKPAFATRQSQGNHAYAVCPDCGEAVRNTQGDVIWASGFPDDKTLECIKCHSPLWTLTHAHVEDKANSALDTVESVKKALCNLPTIGKKRAEMLLQQFGKDFIANMLGDNIHQFINLMDESGNLLFSDTQALRLEKALSQMEFCTGQSNYQLSEYVKRYLPKHFFSLLIVDEAHEFKNAGSAQGQAMGVLASQAQKVLLLTGTLMGGYADDLFYLLWRIMPKNMIEDGYRARSQSLAGASLQFMEQHGVLKRIRRSEEGGNHKTARGKRNTVRTVKAPGFGPKGIARYILPYTAFLKLQDIGQINLPPYHEHFIEVQMTMEQASRYETLSRALTAELRKALAKGSTALLGVIMHCLLAWPDCCFREEIVKHPQSKALLAYVPQVLDDNPSPKEQEMLRLCKAAKAVNQKVLVYTTYTGTRDTAARLKTLLDTAGFKAAVLRSSVPTDKREDWIDEQVENHIDVLICNPELVKTGLDLVGFPQIIFMQSGFNTYVRPESRFNNSFN